MSPSTVLVTGARRFIGGQLAARLADDHRICPRACCGGRSPSQEL
jgi:nucleoside-diphosphate-sugar epimerase